MSRRANSIYLFPEQKQERIGVWIVGPPGCGKTSICHGVRDVLSDWRLHLVDSDDPWFAWARSKTPEELAKTISNFCKGLTMRPIVVCSVEGPPDHDRWVVFGIDQPVTESMRERPEAYDAWISGEDKAPRAIDTWRASGVIHYVLRGSQAEMTEQVVNRIKQEWVCST